MVGTESGDRGEVHAHKDTTCFSLVWVLQRPPARTLQNAIIDSQQVEKKEGRKQTEILLKKDFDVEVGLSSQAYFMGISFQVTMCSTPLARSILWKTLLNT